MADIHIQRSHQLGLAGAREVARQWTEEAEGNFGMKCSYKEGGERDEVGFSRSGVSGTLLVTADRFELDVKLGFLLGAFRRRIEAEVVKNLDQLLAANKPASRKKKA